MSRRVRPHLPGSTFHLATRLQGSERLFEPDLRTALVGIIREQLVYTDLELLAYAIMPNHLHLIVRQGQKPLSAFMQPILRRVALLVHRRCEREGHVFERRYRHTACADPEHLRNAIVYTHLNPVRADLCKTVDDYAWTSHAAWSANRTACDGGPDPTIVERGLPLFATSASRTASQLVADYHAFITWRIATDRLAALGEPSSDDLVVRPRRPQVVHGDLNWLHAMTPRPAVSHADDCSPRCGAATGRLDLADVARAVIVESGAAVDLALVRSRWGGPAYHRVRDAIVMRAAGVGYSGVQIAAYLNVSPSAVSRVISRHRRKHLDRSR